MSAQERGPRVTTSGSPCRQAAIPGPTDSHSPCWKLDKQACTILPMSGLFDGTPLEQPVTCGVCKQPLARCTCPRNESGDVLLPKDQAVRVGREKRRKGKTVTVISGLDPAMNDAN